MFCPFIVDESPQRGQTSIKHPVWLCSNSPFWMVKSNFERLHFMYLRSLGPHIERSADKNPEATAAGFLLWANSTLEVAVTSQFSSWIPLSRDFFSGTDWMNLYEFQECRLAHGEFIGCLLAVCVCWRVYTCIYIYILSVPDIFRKPYGRSTPKRVEAPSMMMWNWRNQENQGPGFEIRTAMTSDWLIRELEDTYEYYIYIFTHAGYKYR